VWAEKSDPDGDGDRHLVLVVRKHLRIVKLPKRFDLGPLPRLGTPVDAVGYVMRGARGRSEVDAARIAFGDRVHVAPLRLRSGR
jgi:hypothetical protein